MKKALLLRMLVVLFLAVLIPSVCAQTANRRFIPLSYNQILRSSPDGIGGMCTLENNGGELSVIHYAGETREVLVSESELKGKKLVGEYLSHYPQSALACQGKNAFFNLYAPSPELYDGYSPVSEVWQKKFGSPPAVLFAKGASIYSGSSLSNNNGKIVAIVVASILVGGEPKPTSRRIFMDITEEPYRLVLDTLQYRGVSVSWPMDGGCLMNSGYSIVVRVGTSSSSILQVWKILPNGEKRILASPIQNSPLSGTPIACYGDTTIVSSNDQLLVGTGLSELTPLNAGRNFSAITNLSAGNGKAMFLADGGGGKAVYRVDLSSGASEIFKSQDDSPAGVPISVVMSGTEIYLLQSGGSATAYYVSYTPVIPVPVIANLKAEPAAIEPGQPVKISWDLIGQAKSTTLNPAPGNVTFSGSGHYEIMVYPTATTSYTVSVEWAGGPPITKSVTVTVLLPPIPPPEILGIANGASFDLNQPLAPGTIFSLFGKNLGTAESVRSWPLPRKLGGAKVTICGADAPLFASTGPMARLEGNQLWQINGVVPSIAASPSCEVVVSVDQKSPTATLTARAQVKISSKSEETLALFTFTGFHPNGAQTQEPIITNQQGQLVAPPGVSIPGADPAMFTQARACEVITLWPTGGGRTIPSVADGEPASGTSLARMEMSPVVQIYGVDAEILFAGLAPGFAGLYQINVRVPCEATPGEQWLWFGRLPNTGKVYKISIQ